MQAESDTFPMSQHMGMRRDVEATCEEVDRMEDMAKPRTVKSEAALDLSLKEWLI